MKTALIIGGGGGIGRAICRTLLVEKRKEVTRLVIAQRSRPEESFLHELSSFGARIDYEYLDISSASSRLNFEKAAPEKIHYLIHCAGICPRENFLEMTEEIWDEVLDTNLKGPLFLTQALYPKLQAAERASICFITSLAGRFGGRGSSVAYTASKAGLDASMKALAKFGGATVSCFSVAPGPTSTEMLSLLRSEEMQKITSAGLTGEINSPEEVAQLIVQTLGRLGQTGQVIDINHGMYLA